MKLHRTVLLSAVFIIAAVCLTETALCSDSGKYLNAAKKYADTMIDKGRDHYGSESTPLFAVSLDRRTQSIHEGKALVDVLAIERGDWGIRSHDRMVQGANPMQDQNLYRLLYALSDTGSGNRYAEAADDAFRYFFNHCQSDVTGLFAWGEHIGWDFKTEKVIEKPSGFLHEFARPWLLWDRSFKLAETPCERFANGLWDHQLADKESVHYSRHAYYDKHQPGRGSEYPRHGGFYIATWAEAYSRTKDPVFLEAIETLTNAFQARRHYLTDGLLAETQSPDLMWPHSGLSLAVDLWEGADKVPAELGAKMRSCASRTDKVFLRIAHNLAPGGEGFMTNTKTSTFEPGWWRGGKLDPSRPNFTQTWATGYGQATDAQVAMLCLLRYRQVKLDGFKKLILDTAARYLVSEPDTSIALYPGALADAIALMIGTYELSGETKYLDRAEFFANQAIAIFFDDNSGLPRASSKHGHYEAITRGDTLALELLHLWAVKNGKDVSPKLVEYTER